MDIRVSEHNGVKIAVVYTDEVLITNVQDALDFMMTVRHQSGCGRIALPKEALAADFFTLSSGLAGEILQKFVNYQFKLAILGDFSAYTSKPLNDFIYECNSGREVFFVASAAEAVERLAAAL